MKPTILRSMKEAMLASISIEMHEGAPVTMLNRKIGALRCIFHHLFAGHEVRRQTVAAGPRTVIGTTLLQEDANDYLLQMSDY
jgi:hypothetical protein